MKTKIGKKGQLKILESVAVLIVFFFLVGMGISFYGRIQLQSLDAAKEEFGHLDAIKISQKIVHLPELRCSIQNTDQGSCIDLYQALAWASLSYDDTCRDALGGDAFARDLCGERLGHYFEQIGPGEVVLTRIYTQTLYRQSEPADIVLYNYTIDVKSEGETKTQIPLIIYDSVTQTNDLGVLKVRVFQ